MSEWIKREAADGTVYFACTPEQCKALTSGHVPAGLKGVFKTSLGEPWTPYEVDSE